MNNDTSFRRITAISTIMAAFLILAASLVLLMAVDFNSEFLSNPGGLITAGLDAGAAGLFRWGSILELWGYFLFLIPASLYLWYWLKPRSSEWVTLYTLLGLSSIALGIIGAAIRATFWPSMMTVYPQLPEAQGQVLQVVFTSLTDFTFEGLYALDSILAGAWWLGIGLILRGERRILGIVTAIMGAAILGAGFGWLLQIDPLARLEMVYFLEPFWAIWLGVVIWRRAEPRQPALEPAAAA
jgi:hypothetical protein